VLFSARYEVAYHYCSLPKSCSWHRTDLLSSTWHNIPQDGILQLFLLFLLPVINITASKISIEFSNLCLEIASNSQEVCENKTINCSLCSL
jgi:hypothetical protein